MIKPYVSVYSRLEEKRQYLRNELEYKEFCEFVISIDYGNKLNEFTIPSGLKSKIDFITTLAKETGNKIIDIMKIFMNKTVFNFFNNNKIGWSIKKVYELIKKGYDYYHMFYKEISKYIHDMKITKWTKEQVEKLDVWLQENPRLKHIIGIGVGALLLFIWFNMSFKGGFDDIDLSIILEAIKGNYNLSDIFLSPQGIEMLGLFLTNQLTGLSLVYTGSSLVDFSIALIYTLGKQINLHLRKN